MRRKLKQTTHAPRRSKSTSSFFQKVKWVVEHRREIALTVAMILPALAWGVGWMQQGASLVLDTANVALMRSGFIVDDILVEGRIHTSSEDILSAAGVLRGQSIFDFNPQETRQRLTELPWVQSALVQRRLPNQIYIRLVERQAVAIWQNQSKYYLIDSSGEVLGNYDRSQSVNLLLVSGKKAPAEAYNLLKILDQYPQVRSRVLAATYVSGRRWDLILDSKQKVKMPEKDLHAAMEKLEKLANEDGFSQKNIASIDLRLSDRSFLYIEKEDSKAKQKGKLT